MVRSMEGVTQVLDGCSWPQQQEQVQRRGEWVPRICGESQGGGMVYRDVHQCLGL